MKTPHVMNVIVFVKHAVDESELKADASGKAQLQGTTMKMSTFDRNAVEESVRIKETNGGEVTAISLGNQDARKTLKEALAMGVDKAMLVLPNSGDYDASTTSYYLAKAAQKVNQPGLLMCSEGASDTYEGLVGPMIAEWLDVPFFGYVKKINVMQNSMRCEQAYEDRVEISEANLPAMVSVVSEINEPRYPTLLQILQASKKPVEEIRCIDLRGPDAPPAKVEVQEVTVQAVNRKRVVIADEPAEAAKKLIAALRKEGVLK